MAVTTEHFHNGNTSTTTFAYTFPYYKTSDIKVKVDGTLKTESTHYNVTGTNIVFTSGNIPGNGTGNVHIYRETDVDTSKATFAAGSSIRATDLNNNETQLLYHAQEQNFNAIQTADIQDGAITSAKIADGTIATADIATGAINADKIAADAVGASEIAANAVGASELANNAVDTDAILDDAVTSAKIGTSQVAADNIANLAVTTAKLNNTSVTADKLASNSVITAKLDTGAVTAAKIGTDAVTTVKILDNNVTTAKIANDSITADKMADNSVDSEHYVDGSIDSEHIADNAVTATKFGNNVITNAKMADNSVDTAELVDDAVTVAKIDNAQLTTLAGMQSGTASILAGSTALTSTTAELNLLDGKSIVTSVSGSSTDTQLPSAKAVNDQILAITNDLGGFVAIANETSFPATNPDPSDNAGTVVSITDAGGVVVNGSGTATIANGAGTGNTVTITGFPSSVYSTTLADNLGLQVQTTTTLHTYTYHKLLSKEADALNAATAVADFNERYRTSDSAPSSSLHNGDLWFNTTSGDEAMKVYNSTTSAWEVISSTGNYSILEIKDTDGSSPTLDGSVKDFKLVTKGTSNGVTPDHAAQLIVSVNGVIQEPNTGTSTPTNGFAVTGTTIKFSNNLPSNTSVFIAKIGATVDIGTPSNNTVTAAILQNGSVERAKIQADAIDGTKIADDAVAAEHLASDAVVTASIVDDAVTADKLANSINTEIAANTAKVTNATHTGEVTGATALTIADDVVDEANLKISNAGSDGQFLKKNSSAGGGLTWDSVPAGVGGANGVDFNDGVKVRFGTGNDMEIYGQANNAGLITNAAGGIDVSVGASPYQVSLSGWNTSGTPASNLTIVANSGSNTYADLRYDGNVKLATNNTGITVTGTVAATAYTGDGSALTGLDSTKAGGAIYENSQTISTTHTLTANTNGMSAGPVTVNSGITLTIPSGATYTVV